MHCSCKALKLGFLGLKGTKRSVASTPYLEIPKHAKKAILGHFKPKRSSALKMEYPKNLVKSLGPQNLNGHLPSKTRSLDIGFWEKIFCGSKKFQILPSKQLFYFHFQFWSLRQL